MRKDTFILVIGVGIFIIPFLGVPTVWKDIAQFVLGVLLIGTGLVCRMERRRSGRTRGSMTHAEHNPTLESDVTAV